MYNDIYIYLYTYIYLYVIMVLYNTIFWSQGTAGAGPESPLDEVIMRQGEISFLEEMTSLKYCLALRS